MSTQTPSVVVIGNFDGVHLGHQALISQGQAQAPGLPLIVVTFWPHPQSVIRPGSEPSLLLGLADRIEQLRHAGAAEVRIVHFTKDFMTWTPEMFVDKVIRPLNPQVVVVGQNFRFGAKAAGSVETLEQLGEGRFRVQAVDLVQVDGLETCSSLIREALSEGNVELANEQLGRPFRYRGTVVMGHQRGRELGFPTANLPVSGELAAPADGVYAGWLTRLDEPGAEPMPAAISVGTNPTFDDVPEVVVEAYVLDRDDLELYGLEVAVDFIARLRGNVKFEGLEALITQMTADVDKARQILGVARP